VSPRNRTSRDCTVSEAVSKQNENVAQDRRKK
jgi:hypothetical protein